MSSIKFLEVYDNTKIESLTRLRNLETKLGQKVHTISKCNNLNDLKIQISNCKAEFVILGIPEDIGVRANYGRAGADSAWQPTLDNLLNIQSNHFLVGDELLVLGHISFDDLMYEASRFTTKTYNDIKQLRTLVEKVDERVFEIVSEIAQTGKKIILIGGGHNNSYPIIKAISKAKTSAINIVNIDPHSDFRPQEGRHSGNGFSYAFYENYIKNYSVVGLHESYNSSNTIEQFMNNSNLHFYTYEDIAIRQTYNLDNVLNQCISKNNNTICGLEIDLDSIQNIPSSAKTSSGFLPVDIRKFITQFSKSTKPLYIHIAEGAPTLSHIKTDNKTGKLISYLITDFIKASTSKPKI